MASNNGDLIVVGDGHWMHVRVTRVYHRHYPEVRGEGRSLREALNHLARLLARDLDRVHGARREAVERALADLHTIPRARNRTPRRPMAVIP